MEKTQEHKSHGQIYSRVVKKIQTLFPLFRKDYTYISEQIVIQGDIDAEKNLVVDGRMSGNIRSEKHVSLGATAHFEGGISCQSATISGYVKGCIRASQTLVVRTPATVIGDLIAASVQVEPGVVLRGKIFSDPLKQHAELLPEVQWKPLEPILPVEPVEN